MKMKATREELIEFLEKKVLIPVENHPNADDRIKKKITISRNRLNQLDTAAKVERFFWNAQSSANGIDSYKRISQIGAPTFEDVSSEFKMLCGRR